MTWFISECIYNMNTKRFHLFYTNEKGLSDSESIVLITNNSFLMLTRWLKWRLKIVIRIMLVFMIDVKAHLHSRMMRKLKLGDKCCPISCRYTICYFLEGYTVQYLVLEWIKTKYVALFPIFMYYVIMYSIPSLINSLYCQTENFKKFQKHLPFGGSCASKCLLLPRILILKIVQ